MPIDSQKQPPVGPGSEIKVGSPVGAACASGSEVRAGFPTTRWSLVVHARDGNNAEAREAFGVLCGLYWYPLYAFARRQGLAHHDAEDRTQDFLSGLIEQETLGGFTPERGRFRAFLLTALRHRLVDEWRGARAAKRGGGRPILSLNMEMGAERFAHEPTDPALTPEQMFDRNWALAMCDGAMTELQGEYERTGRGKLFATLKPLILNRVESGTMRLHAAHLGMDEHPFTVALHRVRKRFGERLRQRVTDTVNDQALVNEELRYLLTAMGG